MDCQITIDAKVRIQNEWVRRRRRQEVKNVTRKVEELNEEEGREAFRREVGTTWSKWKNWKM